MIKTRLAFVAFAVAALAGTFATAKPVEAHGGCGRSSHRVVRSYRTVGYGGDYGYGGGYGYRPRRSSYRSGGYCAPRRSRYARSYTRSYYAPSYGTRYAAYDDDYGYRPRRRYSRGYRCGCGQGFASGYWLSYHRDHTGC